MTATSPELRLSVHSARGSAYHLVLRLAALLPLRPAHAVARRLGRIRHRLLRGSLHIDTAVTRALRPAPQQLERWAARASELSAAEIVDVYRYRRIDAAQAVRETEIRGLEHLESALAAGNGALLFCAHIWGIPTAYAVLGQLGFAPIAVGYPPAFSFSPVDARFMGQMAEILERRYGCEFMWMEPGNFDVAVRAVNALRRNRVLVIAIDMPQENAAVPVSWLGGQAYFSLGHAQVAKAAGAALLDLFLYRGDSWFPHVLEIGEPFLVSESPEEAVQRCAARLEAQIRARPAQWRSFSNFDDPRVVARSSGHPFSLRRIEETLATHPAVSAAVALAVPDKAFGTSVRAVVVPAESQEIEERELREYCAQRLPPYMVPSQIDLRDVLPRG